MSVSNLDYFLDLIRDGEPVSAGVANRPTRQIDSQLRFLFQVLQAAAYGQTLYARKVTVAPEVEVGQPVYRDSNTQRFEPAMARLDAVPGAVLLRPAESAQVWGVVKRKHNATLADVLLSGYDQIDISAALAEGEEPQAGLYYLSGVTAGGLVHDQPPIGIPVLRHDGAGGVLVLQQAVDVVDRHAHVRYELTCEPAGNTSPPSPGDRHVLTSDNAALPGWLPADNAVFGGKAPPGAVFGYNLSADPALKAAWPPLPAANAYLGWDRGLDKDVGETGVPLGPKGLCVLDHNGLWWMTNCYGDVPWPREFDTTSRSESTSDSLSANEECPRPLRMRMFVYFAIARFAADTTVVRSLRSKDPRVVVRCIDGTAGVAGDLEVLLNLNLTLVDDQEGSLALKEFDPTTGRFKRGPVVEGVYARSENVTLSGTKVTRTIDGEERELFQGAVGVEVDPAATRELEPQQVWLQGVEETHYDGATYLGFAADETTSFIGKIYVPADTALANPTLALRFRVLGRAAGDLPQLTFTYRRVPRPASGLTTPAALPTSGSDQSLTCVTVATLTATNQYVEAESEAFEVVAGDVVLYTVQRNSGDGYAAELGIIQQSGVLRANADD